MPCVPSGRLRVRWMWRIKEGKEGRDVKVYKSTVFIIGMLFVGYQASG